jgi:hypothetical protein
MILAMRTIGAIFVLLFAVAAISAQEWTQWRGPARDGSVSEKNAPAAWPESLKQSWRVDVGEGYSSPVVAEGRVFVHGRRDPEEIVVGINLADGKVLWQQKYQANFQKNQYAVQMAKGPNSTPLVAGNRLYTLGVTGVLNAWDTATGKQLWTRDFSKTIDTSKLFCGTASSPLVVDGRLVVQVGSDVHGGQVHALNPATGATEWEWRGLGPGYASPVVIDIGGTQQIVSMTEGSIVGLDGKTGNGGVSRRMAREHRHAALDRRSACCFRHAPGHACLLAKTDERQMGSGRDLEEPGYRDVHEFAGFWRRFDLRSLVQEEGTVFCHRREDRRRALDHRRQRRRARVVVAHAATRGLPD